MKQQMNFVVPGKHVYWIALGAMGGMIGLFLDLFLSGTVGESAKWGGLSGSFGAAIGLIALGNKLLARQ